MSDFAQLPTNGRINPRVIVAMEIGPYGRISIEVFAPVDVFQERAAAPDEHQRLALEPVTHLGERMPDVSLIELSQPFAFQPSLGIGSLEFLHGAKFLMEGVAEPICRGRIAIERPRFQSGRRLVLAATGPVPGPPWDNEWRGQKSRAPVIRLRASVPPGLHRPPGEEWHSGPSGEPTAV